jgi:Tfp pilus assembly protein PilW
MTGPRRAGRVREEGLSLVELLVAMMITGVLLAAVGAVFSGTMRAVRQMNVKTATQSDLRVATEAMTRSLRVAYQPKGETSAIVRADRNSISFYALMNRTIGTTTSTAGAVVEPLPIRVDYAWDTTTKCLNESWTSARTLASPPAAGPFYAWDTGTRTKCLVLTTDPPVFSYYASGQLTSGSTTVAPLVTPAPSVTLSAAQRQQVLSIQVALKVVDPANANLGGSDATVRVALENVQIAAGGN